jgi:hypothetical protein
VIVTFFKRCHDVAIAASFDRCANHVYMDSMV